MGTDIDEKTESRLRRKILSFNVHNDDMDEAIDDFVGYYDSNEWCRGWFKSQIAMLVLEAKNLTKHNNDFKKVCPKCRGTKKLYQFDGETWFKCDLCKGTGKPISKS